MTTNGKPVTARRKIQSRRPLVGAFLDAVFQSAALACGCVSPTLFSAMRNWRAGMRRLVRPVSAAVASSCLAALAAAACVRSGPPLSPYQDESGSPPPVFVGAEGGSFFDVDLGDPFAITGLQPSHGPWTGGTHSSIAGRGFSSSIQVWIGPTLLDPSQVFASDPTRASVVTPAGTSGAADVRIRNIATAQERTLVAGFFYDSFVASPNDGATTGGTRIVLRGNGTHWTDASSVAVGGRPCSSVTFTDAANLACTTPAGAPGSDDMTVTNADGTLDRARDAFTYVDSPDGYRGGLHGGALSGNLTVLAFDAWVGTPLLGGKAIAGSNIATAIVGTLDASGAARLSDPSLSGKVTVTVAAKCHQPITFIDVPVDAVTAYLAPVLDPSCGPGNPPSNGNWYGVEGGHIGGQLVWPGGIEFARANWTNVPNPAGKERRAAYVFATTGNPLDDFQLPPPEYATTPDSAGSSGFAYSTTTLPGSRTLYALAGLEDRSVDPPRFVPYAIGIARGVFVQPGMKTDGIDIPMTSLFDHALSTVPQTPASTPRGPDRLLSTLALNVGTNQFAILPQGKLTTLLPVAGAVAFVGVPSLDRTLSGSSYDLTEAAVSGANHLPPMSVVTRIETTLANDPLTVGGFFSIPALLQPSAGKWGATHVALQANGPIDLVVVNVSSGNGLVGWQIVGPGSDLSFDVPDLAQLPGVGTLVRGPITTTFSIARMAAFDYARLRYGQLSSGAWSAYAIDTAAGSY